MTLKLLFKLKAEYSSPIVRELLRADKKDITPQTEATESPVKRPAPFCLVMESWCFQALATQSKVQSLKGHSRCHWGLHQLNKSKLGGRVEEEEEGI